MAKSSMLSGDGYSLTYKRAVGLYPARLLQRRNTDHLYHHALRDLYGRLNLPFTIIDHPVYNLLGTLYYQAANRCERPGLAAARRWFLARRLRLRVPKACMGEAVLFHGAFFGLPANVTGNIIHENEFYDFGERPDAARRRVNDLSSADLDKMRALLVRTELSRQYFFRQYEECYHHLVKVVPFHMPYLARWESREPAKPDAQSFLTFIFVGNQAKRKGLDFFVRFAKEVRSLERRRTLRFIVVSNFQDGSDFDLHGMEIHQGLNGEAVQDLMEQSHFLMLPTRKDSHPKVCYEAAATGCGLIISDIRPLADIWTEGAHTFPLSGGMDAMRVLAEAVCSRPADYINYGQCNRRRFLREFAPSASASLHREAILGPLSS